MQIQDDGRHDANDPLALIRPDLISARELAIHAFELPFIAAQKPARSMAVAKADMVEYQEIARTVHDWAQAWSKKDIDTYFLHYASEFTTHDPRFSLDQWRQQRRQRLNKQGSVEVKVRDLKVELASPNQAEVFFIQDFRNGARTEVSKKTLLLKRQDNQWRIVAETVE